MKKAITILMALILVVFSFSACAAPQPATEAASTEAPAAVAEATEAPAAPVEEGFQLAQYIKDKVANNEQLEIIAVHQDVSTVFSQTIGNGVRQAGVDLGIKVDYTGGTQETDIENMVALIENLITRKVDGIMVANVNGQALNPVIDKALAAGIPVITFGTDSEGSGRLAFVGQDYKNSGIQQAKILGELMNGEGKIIITSCATPAQWSVLREAGVREGMAQYWPNIEIVNIFDTGTEDQTVYSTIENALKSNPDVTGLASLCSVTTPVAGRVINRLGLGDTIIHVGHDLEPEILENMVAGATKASLSQDPYKQGYEGIKMLYDFIMNGVVPSNLDTGIKPVFANEAEDLLKRLEAGEPIG